MHHTTLIYPSLRNQVTFFVSILLLAITLIQLAPFTLSSTNSTLRDWLIDLKVEADKLELSSLKLQKAIAILSYSNNTSSIASIRTSQLRKINLALDLIKQEISIINSTCFTNSGPDCTIPICDSKCLNCSSPGKCLVCSGKFDGLDCSTCKTGWRDISLNCTTPICDSKCSKCLSPGLCSECILGNWNPLSNCSTCKAEWSGTNCTIPVCDSKCLNCTSPGQCVTCLGNWMGSNCSTCKSGWGGSNCTSPACDSKCTSCYSSFNCTTCSGNWIGSNCSTCKTGWTGSDCNSPNNIGDIVNSTVLTNTIHSVRLVYEIMSGISMANKRLLYRASRDGFSASTYHTNCDNKGPTLLLVKSKNGAIFGGYARLNPTSGVTVSDSAAFLFSIVSSTGQERFTKLTQDNSIAYRNGNRNFPNSLYYNAAYGPSFGGGSDLAIVLSDLNNVHSYSVLCYTYCDATMAYNSDIANNYLAGATSSPIEDYEVYALQ